MSKTLSDLKAVFRADQNGCPTCGKYSLHPDGVHTCHEHPFISTLIAKAQEDEKRIEELTKRTEYFASLDRAWAVGMEKSNDDLRVQFAAEREAHEATRKQLEEADKALKDAIYTLDATEFGRTHLENAETTLPTFRAALARQQARDKEGK